MTIVSYAQPRFSIALTVLAALLAVGCEKEEGISLYQAPKEVAATRPIAGETAVGAGADTAAAQQLHWDVPAGWKEAPAQQMRFATFIVNEGTPPVELTVIPLGPEAGALLPNINRWEGQLGLPHTSQDKLGTVVKHQKIGDLEADVVDLTGPGNANPRQRMLAAMVPHGGKVWFFKMSGPVDIVSAQKENFDKFIASLHPGHAGGEDAHAGHDHGDDHAGHDHAGHDHGDAKAGPVSKLAKWNAPAGWTRLPDAKAPRMLAFSIGAGEQAGEVVATRFTAGNAGSFLDNVNRWRGQLGLPPVEDPESIQLKDTTVGNDGQGVTVEFENPQASPQGGKKMVVLVASARGDLWFFKLTGPTDLVDKERANFDAFVKSLEFGGEGEPAAAPH